MTAAKCRQLVRLATAYIAKYRLDDIPCRFDVVEVVERPGAPRAFTLLADAFQAE